MSAPLSAAPATDVLLAERFLRALWGDTVGYVALSHAPLAKPGARKPILRTDWFSTSDFGAAAKRAVALCAKVHVWIGAGLHAKAQPPGQRGGSDDVVAIPGLWADVDFSDPVHKKAEHLPPDLSAAVGLVRTVAIPPTFLVHTGHGLQPWWLFKEPLLLDTPETRARATSLLNRLKQQLSAEAARHDWKVDAVADLARVMRLPGLLNIKAEPVPVRIIEENEQERYDPSDFDLLLPALAAAMPTVKTTITPRATCDASDELLLRKAMNAKNGTEFTRLWRGDNSMHADDASRADQALTNLLTFWAGPDPARIDALFRQSARLREKWDEKHYSDGRTYGAGTIDTAIKGCKNFYEWPKVKVRAGNHEIISSTSPEEADDAVAPDACGIGPSDIHDEGESAGSSKPAWRPKPEQIIEFPEPLRFSEHYLRARALDPQGRLTLRRYREEWWRYVSGTGYRNLSEEAQDATLYQHLDGLWIPHRDKEGNDTGDYEKVVARSGLVREVRLALPSRGLIVNGVMPQWLDERSSPAPFDVIAFKNGLLDTAAYCQDEATPLIAPTPEWFSAVACPYAFNPSAACPVWLKFLDEAFESDQERVDLLQEWMGYLLVPDNRMEAFMMLVGKPRAGKGTTIDAITAMLGDDQVGITNFTKLASRFGLHPLLGKLAAVMPDAHVSRTTDSAGALEVLKSITGNDEQSIDRKGIDELPKVRLPLRFTIAVNELPQLPDTAGALKPRLKLLYYGVSFAGREDRTLKARIKTEAQGIAVWALRGLYRLRAMGEFTEPASCRAMVEEFQRLISPVKCFVSECCEIDPATYVEKAALYARWSEWCRDRGDEPGNNAQFGQQLFSAYSDLSERRRGPRGQQFTTYEGVRICL